MDPVVPMPTAWSHKAAAARPPPLLLLAARRLLLPGLLLLSVLPDTARAPRLHLDSMAPTCADAASSATRRTTEFEYSHIDPVVLWQLAAKAPEASWGKREALYLNVVGSFVPKL